MTPSERERRIEAAAEALNREALVLSGERLIAECCLDAADEAVPMVSLADVISVLDSAYHPQMGFNPTHPVDVIRASFSGEEGTER